MAGTFEDVQEQLLDTTYTYPVLPAKYFPIRYLQVVWPSHQDVQDQYALLWGIWQNTIFGLTGPGSRAHHDKCGLRAVGDVSMHMRRFTM